MENDIFWSEIGSGFGVLGGTPHRELPGAPPGMRNSSVFLQFSNRESNGRGIGKLRKRFCDYFIVVYVRGEQMRLK